MKKNIKVWTLVCSYKIQRLETIKNLISYGTHLRYCKKMNKKQWIFFETYATLINNNLIMQNFFKVFYLGHKKILNKKPPKKIVY